MNNKYQSHVLVYNSQKTNIENTVDHPVKKFFKFSPPLQGRGYLCIQLEYLLRLEI